MIRILRDIRGENSLFDTAAATKTLLHVETRFALRDIVESFGMDQLAAVKHHAQKAGATRDPMGDTTRNVGHLPGIQLESAPLGVIQRMTSKLKPDLVFIAAAVKSIL